MLSALLVAHHSAAQYPSYPTYPTTTSPTTTSPTTPPAAHSVTIAGSDITTYRFRPKTVRIKRGKTVTWSWMSNAAHNVTFKALGKHSKSRASFTYKLRFNTPGTYHYMCTIHGFRGKIVVHK